MQEPSNELTIHAAQTSTLSKFRRRYTQAIIFNRTTASPKVYGNINLGRSCIQRVFEKFYNHAGEGHDGRGGLDLSDDSFWEGLDW
jgi:hypothetical protein